MKFKIIFFVFFIFSTASNAVTIGKCEGHFVNPIKDVCWTCLFPLSIGGSKIVKSQNGLTDTLNPTSPIGVCGKRVGLQIGYWEPFAIADVTDTPYCFVNLGGFKLPFAHSFRRGGRLQTDIETRQAFYHVHWYKYPLIHWLNLLMSAGCEQNGDFDLLWLTELDPTWSDSDLGLVLNPDAIFFANPVAQAACAADSLSSTILKKPLDPLFWCAGTHGNHYPLTGHVTETQSPIQMAWLLTERMNFKLHRQMQIADTIGINNLTCLELRYPFIPKSRYRYELVNQVSDGKHCYPSGYSPLLMEAGKVKPHQSDQFGFLIWRKRNCTFL